MMRFLKGIFSWMVWKDLNFGVYVGFIGMI